MRNWLQSGGLSATVKHKWIAACHAIDRYQPSLPLGAAAMLFQNGFSRSRSQPLSLQLT